MFKPKGVDEIEINVKFSLNDCRLNSRRGVVFLESFSEGV